MSLKHLSESTFFLEDVTRRPLRLTLLNDPTVAQYPGVAEFEHLPGQKFEDFAIVRQQIEEATNQLAPGKSVSNQEIVLTI